MFFNLREKKMMGIRKYYFDRHVKFESLMSTYKD